jgi:hypothetical protein
VAYASDKDEQRNDLPHVRPSVQRVRRRPDKMEMQKECDAKKGKAEADGRFAWDAID